MYVVTWEEYSLCDLNDCHKQRGTGYWEHWDISWWPHHLTGLLGNCQLSGQIMLDFYVNNPLHSNVTTEFPRVGLLRIILFYSMLLIRASSLWTLAWKAHGTCGTCPLHFPCRCPLSYALYFLSSAACLGTNPEPGKGTHKKNTL